MFHASFFVCISAASADAQALFDPAEHVAAEVARRSVLRHGCTPAVDVADFEEHAWVGNYKFIR